MKIMSYNIFEGGVARGSDRTEVILGVIRASNPDVLGLCECSGFLEDGGRRLKHFESALGMRSIINDAASGDHIAILYRNDMDIVGHSASSVMMFHGFCSIVVALPRHGRTTIMMTHLHPRSSIFRLAEAQSVLAKATFEDNAIVMGDFNLVPDSGPVPNDRELSLNARVRLLNLDGSIDTSIGHLFRVHGFVDLGAEAATPTYPTKLFGKDQRDGIRIRLDYMFASPRLASVATLSTVTTEQAQVASDHLPLLCELET